MQKGNEIEFCVVQYPLSFTSIESGKAEYTCSLTKLFTVCWLTSKSPLDFPKIDNDQLKIESERVHLRNYARSEAKM